MRCARASYCSFLRRAGLAGEVGRVHVLALLRPEDPRVLARAARVRRDVTDRAVADLREGRARRVRGREQERAGEVAPRPAGAPRHARERVLEALERAQRELVVQAPATPPPPASAARASSSTVAHAIAASILSIITLSVVDVCFRSFMISS